MKTMVVMEEIKKILIANFGARIEKVILFGSQTGDEIRKESDTDILVIVNGKLDWKIKKAIQDLCYTIDLKYDILTDIKVLSSEDIKGIKGLQPFIQNALSLGIAV